MLGEMIDYQFSHEVEQITPVVFGGTNWLKAEVVTVCTRFHRFVWPWMEDRVERGKEYRRVFVLTKDDSQWIEVGTGELANDKDDGRNLDRALDQAARRFRVDQGLARAGANDAE